MIREKRYGMQVLLASFLAVFCLFGYRSTFALLKDPISQSMGWSQTQVGMGFSLMMIFYAFTSIFSGILLDKFGSKPAYFIAAILAFCGFFIAGLSENLLLYLLSFGLMGGIATGMLWVTATISVRKWYIGKTYSSVWGLAFLGAPVAQLFLSHLIKWMMPGDEIDEWRFVMRVLAIIMFSFLVLATLFAKKSPEKYNLIPFGAEEQKSEKKPFTLSACFSAYPIWGLILTFLFCMMAEFLLWTQLVSYWRFDLNWDTATAIKTYSLIGLAGIITMPLMGLLADKMVKHSKNEIQGRKRMLLIGSILGLTATAIIISVGNSLGLTYLACFIFAIYWAIIPGGVVGYTGSVYGRKNLGKIWGLVTLIVMAIGPFVGTFMGSWLKDTSGFYRYSLFFSLFSFSLAVIFAATLPVKIKNS